MPDTATRAKTHSKNPGHSFIFHYMKLIRSVPLSQVDSLKDLSLLLKGTGLLRTKNRYCIQRGENHYQGNHSQDFALSRGHSLTLWARPTRQAWNLTRHTVSIEPGCVPTLPTYICRLSPWLLEGKLRIAISAIPRVSPGQRWWAIQELNL